MSTDKPARNAIRRGDFQCKVCGRDTLRTDPDAMDPFCSGPCWNEWLNEQRYEEMENPRDPPSE